MSKTQQKSLAYTLLLLIIGVVHFFFGRAILSAVFFLVEIGLFWILGAVIALLFMCALIGTVFNSNTLDKAEKWLDKKLSMNNCDCEDCECDDDDDEIECHVEIRRKKKERACESENQECECEEEEEEEEEEDACDYPYCDECIRECELNEDPDTVEEEIPDTVEEESSESDDEIEK